MSPASYLAAPPRNRVWSGFLNPNGRSVNRFRPVVPSRPVARPILVNRRGGPVRVLGEILEPGPAPLKIDVWRHVRHPPPDLIHVYTVKSAMDEVAGSYVAGHPTALWGKVISWVWVYEGGDQPARSWRVRIDVQQDGASLPGYPAEYSGPLPPGLPLAHLKISEEVDQQA